MLQIDHDRHAYSPQYYMGVVMLTKLKNKNMLWCLKYVAACKNHMIFPTENVNEKIYIYICKAALSQRSLLSDDKAKGDKWEYS